MARTVVVRIVLENREARQGLRDMDAAVKKLGTAVDKLDRSVDELGRDMDKAGGKAKNFDLSIGGITSAFLRSAAVATVYQRGVQLIGEALRTGIVDAIDYQHEIMKIAAVTGDAQAVVASLEKTIRAVSLETRLSQKEMAATALEMSKLGLSSREVESALLGVAQLSRALDEDLVEVGRTVVGILNAYSFSAEEAGRITDQLAFTVKVSALDIQSFGVAFSYVGGTASAAGLQFEELAGAMDVLSNAGIRSSTIGTQLRRIIADLSDENSKASRIINGETIQSAGGLSEALELLARKNLDIADYTYIFGRTASSVAAILVKYSDVIQDMQEQTEKSTGLNAKMSDQMNTTLKSAIDNVKRSWGEMIIEMMGSQGVLASMANGLAKILRLLTAIAAAPGISNKEMALVPQFQKAEPEAYKRFMTATGISSSTDPRAAHLALVKTKEYQEWFNRTIDAQKNEAEVRENIVAMLKRTITLGKGDAYKVTDQKAYDAIFKTFTKGGTVDKAEFQKNVWRAVKQLQLGREMEGDNEFSAKELLSEEKAQKTRIELWGQEEQVLRELEFAYRDVNRMFKELSVHAIGGEDQISRLMGFKIQKTPQLDVVQQAQQDLGLPLSGGPDDPNEARRAAARERKTSEWQYQNELIQNLTKSFKELSEAEGGAGQAVLAFGESFIVISGTLTSIGAMLNQTSYQFGEQLVESIVRGKNAFKDFDDVFGQIAKQIIAQLVALTIRFALFRLVMAAFGGPGGVLGASGTFGGAVQKSMFSEFTPKATGGDQVVDRPTLFMAGEAGRERVKVTPRGKMSGGDGGGITVNIHGDVLDGEKFTAAVAMAQKRLKGRYV